ncbi:CLUMA_CG010194, isoform A [Clunio marinus]|uniref:CLUMA_CG010194, isoform A n=1 Tax=Clunio marinus TaxID=568069 RepID=A0A1J1IA99_9DIPT|nr:CLUMA_CG010194, isoform A [Clunio marinus]
MCVEFGCLNLYTSLNIKFPFMLQSSSLVCNVTKSQYLLSLSWLSNNMRADSSLTRQHHLEGSITKTALFCFEALTVSCAIKKIRKRNSRIACKQTNGTEKGAATIKVCTIKPKTEKNDFNGIPKRNLEHSFVSNTFMRVFFLLAKKGGVATSRLTVFNGDKTLIDAGVDFSYLFFTLTLLATALCVTNKKEKADWHQQINFEMLNSISC